MTARFGRRRILLPLSIGALPCLAITLTPSASRSTAYEPRQEKKKDAGPNYPRVNLATTYEVDPHWPKRPSHFEWGHVPGIAVDRQDRVYVFTRAVPPVQLYDADGNFLRAWGEAEIKTAHHIKVGPDGTIWLSDIGHHVVMQFTPEGRLLRTLGTKGEAGEDSTHLNKPTDMAITPSGDVFVTDGYGNNRVVHFDGDGRFVKTWGRLGTKPGEFSVPHAIALDSKGRLYVADRNNARVQVFDQSGRFLAEWRDKLVPWGFAVTRDDEIWVCGSSPMRWRAGDQMLGVPPKDQVFMKFDTDGRLLQLWTAPVGVEGHARPGDCIWVHCMAVDSKGDLYAGDIMGKRAQKFVRQR
jgi:DNA-binding beta-propeller fold protein YncE